MLLYGLTHPNPGTNFFSLLILTPEVKFVWEFLQFLKLLAEKKLFFILSILPVFFANFLPNKIDTPLFYPEPWDIFYKSLRVFGI